MRLIFLTSNVFRQKGSLKLWTRPHENRYEKEHFAKKSEFFICIKTVLDDNAVKRYLISSRLKPKGGIH